MIRANRFARIARATKIVTVKLARTQPPIEVLPVTVRDIIMGLGARKGGGHDGLPIAVFQGLPFSHYKILADHLSEILNDVTKDGGPRPKPKSWEHTLVTLLPKTKQSRASLTISADQSSQPSSEVI